MATNLTSAGGTLNGIQVEYHVGWEQDTELELAMQFISEGGDYLLKSWHEFLKERAEAEVDNN